ncbi:uncharacterized protein LOC126992319 [Eriocheir sinensis]|uniref:uncharacterized protein LOC126992319 n=1 Tax=Eriocheir sinensis TaxID=95602 RepID=UPI0021C8434C|nr:uncharacterized protein LOC126992319 [Eriocheir sinensis]
MGDFNAHHTHWEPSLLAAQQNRSGHSLVDFLTGSASFSLLTPPDLPTRIDPASGRASTLDLCLAVGALADTLVEVGSHCFTFCSSQPPRLLRTPWWNRQCEAAVRAKRGAFNAWRRRPIPELRRRFHQLEARSGDAQKVEHLALHFHTRLGSPDPVPPPILPPPTPTHPIAKPFLPQELTADIAALPRGLDTISHWCTQWGLTLCAPKSCLMCFTRRRIPAIPQAHLTGTVIPFRTTHRFLGLVLDDPRLTWRHHISDLRISCLPRLNLMRALAGVKWGADRVTLLHFYRAYIRSKIDYGCEVYGSASPTLLLQLQVVQNTALRIALGAFRSSPTLALQAEAGIPSLDHRRNTKTVTTFHRITSSPHSSLHTVLSQHRPDPLPAPQAFRAHTPFITRALSIYTSLSVTPPPFSPLAHLSPLGPWFPFPSFISLDLQSPWTKADCPHQGKALFLSLLSTKYKNTFFIFTDGSHIPSPPSTSAAVYLPALHTSTNWKLHPHTTILTAATTLPPHQPVSLFTDSLTSLQLISTHKPHTHHTLCFAIHSLLAQLTSGGRRVHLQWVPSHSGIVGNTVADQAANLAHSHPQPIHRPPDHSDVLIHLQQSSNRHWTTRLTADLRLRPLDTAITRLRIGHTCLNAHLHRLNMVQDPHCPWCPTQPDTPEHLLHCPRFHSLRTNLKASLTRLHIHRPTLEDLLGSNTLSPNTAFQALKCTQTFLQKSGQLNRI